VKLSREKLEEREKAVLAPYAVFSRESKGRRHDEPEPPYRTRFQRDRDRIVHSTAFRRMEYKTQVFVNHEGDYYRTRLTHTIEVAQIARSLALALGANEDLVEAIALAHDMGHTPFGHSGEDALREMMKEHGGFEHNRHGLRVVDVLEKRYPGFPGLNLTYEVREGMAKHTTNYDNPAGTEFDGSGRCTLEGQLVELADSIAYNSHDIDDGIKSGLVDMDDLAGLELWERAAAKVRDAFGRVEPDIFRVQSVRFMITMQIQDAIEATNEAIERAGVASADDVRRLDGPLACFSERMARIRDELSDFLFAKLYRHFRVVRMAEKAKRFLKELFSQYLANLDQLPTQYRERASAEGVDPHTVICDYIAGMTDRFAQDEYLRLFTPYERT